MSYHKTMLAVLAVMVAATTAIAQDKTLLQGQWGDMREESPAKPLADHSDAVLRMRQQHMRATSANFRALEVLINDKRGTSMLALSKAKALAALAEDNGAVFAEVVQAASGGLGAKPQIWEEPELFREHLEAFFAATRALEGHVRSKDETALMPALTSVRYQCLACHYHYAAFKDRPGKAGRRNP